MILLGSNSTKNSNRFLSFKFSCSLSDATRSAISSHLRHMHVDLASTASTTRLNSLSPRSLLYVKTCSRTRYATEGKSFSPKLNKHRYIQILFAREREKKRRCLLLDLSASPSLSLSRSSSIALSLSLFHSLFISHFLSYSLFAK